MKTNLVEQSHLIKKAMKKRNVTNRYSKWMDKAELKKKSSFLGSK